MKPAQLLRAIHPDVLIDNFDIVNFDKSADRFDIYLDEKKVQLKEDKTNPDIISYGFGEYRTIQDYPIRGRATYLHVRKRKWLDKSSNEIFSYDWDLSEFDGTRLNSEFVSFLKTSRSFCSTQRELYILKCVRRHALVNTYGGISPHVYTHRATHTVASGHTYIRIELHVRTHEPARIYGLSCNSWGINIC